MKLSKIEIDEINLIEIAKNYDIKEMSFFGSILRTDFNSESDIDLLFGFQKNCNYSYFDLLELKHKFSETLNRSVDLIEKDSLKNPYRKNEILKTARKFYENN